MYPIIGREKDLYARELAPYLAAKAKQSRKVKASA
jgi:hypothetical protein